MKEDAIINQAKKLMQKMTQKNKAPEWLLTEIAVSKGEKLCKKYNVNRRIVITALYLAHIIFDTKIGGKTQKEHPKLSAKQAKKYLKQWGLNKGEEEIILNSIEAHHEHVATKSLEAEVVKNAECFKFLELRGTLIHLHALGKRDMEFEDSIKEVKRKMEQKYNYLTLPDCKKEGTKNRKHILNLLNNI